LPEWLQKTISQCREWTHQISDVQEPENTGADIQNEEADDIPF
jgi:hypothetical protein